MANSLVLLDPVADLDLYRQAYNFRVPKKHLFGPRISLEAFTDPIAQNLTFGLFNGELLAVYFFQEVEPSCFEAHFTSRKGTPREVLVEGARTVTDLCLEHGASEIYGLILAENRPLRQFVTDIGMKCDSRVIFTCVEDLSGCNFYTRNHRTFLKYAKRA